MGCSISQHTLISAPTECYEEEIPRNIPSAGLQIWLDASCRETITINNDRGVEKWISRGGFKRVLIANKMCEPLLHFEENSIEFDILST